MLKLTDCYTGLSHYLKPDEISHLSEYSSTTTVTLKSGKNVHVSESVSIILHKAKAPAPARKSLLQKIFA